MGGEGLEVSDMDGVTVEINKLAELDRVELPHGVKLAGGELF